jgi:hypothetical protein
MSSTESVTPAPSRVRRVRAYFASTETPRWNATWAALIIVAIVAWMVGAWLLPALGIEPKAGLHFFPEVAGTMAPEPLEQQRYLLALAAALVVAPLGVLIARRRSLDVVTQFAPTVGLLGVIGVVVGSLVRDHTAFSGWLPRLNVLAIVVILVAAAIIVGLSCLWAAPLVRRLDRALRTRPGDAASAVVAFLLSAGVASVCLYTDNNVTLSPVQTWAHMPFTFEDVYAISLGRTPLVDYTPQYSTLLSWLAAPLLSLRVPSIGVFTALMASVTTISLTCLYLAYRMVTGGGGRALLLFVPTVGLGFVPAVILPGGLQIHTIATYFAAMPLRYSGPLVLLMTVIWAAGRPESRRRIVTVGVITAATILMNPEFGVFAGAAAGLATLLVIREDGPWRRSAVLGSLRDLVLGGVAFFALFALATLIRSGSLPDPSSLIYFNRQFASAGFALAPIDHLLGLHVLVFGTCAAAATAGIAMPLFGTMRPGVEGRRSAALLIYAGVFGFGAFAYFVGRSLPGVLGSTFLGWAMALAAICWESARRLQSGGASARVVAPAAVLVLAGAVLIGAGATDRLGYIFKQPERIRADTTNNPALTQSSAVLAARDCLRPGSDTVVFAAMPDRIAREANVRNWLPYNDPLSVVTEEQLDDVFTAIDDHHVDAVLVEAIPLEIQTRLLHEGFVRKLTLPNTTFVPDQPYSWAAAISIWARSDVPNATPCGGK